MVWLIYLSSLYVLDDFSWNDFNAQNQKQEVYLKKDNCQSLQQGSFCEKLSNSTYYTGLDKHNFYRKILNDLSVLTYVLGAH